MCTALQQVLRLRRAYHIEDIAVLAVERILEHLNDGDSLSDERSHVGE